jgi:hypothetical protein
MSTNNLFEQTQLAEAAYANFLLGLSVEDALVAQGFSPAQATEFVKHWRVEDQYKNEKWGRSQFSIDF